MSMADRYDSRELKARELLGAEVTPLTPTQLRVARLVSQGFCNKEIAELAHLHCGTVKHYLRMIFDKLGVDNRVKLARWYWENYETERRNQKLLPSHPAPGALQEPISQSRSR